MRAMVFSGKGAGLEPRQMPRPEPAAGEVLVAVRACGVCRTDLHILDGELAAPKLPLVPGHEIVGTVAGLGAGVTGLKEGQRVGVPWLGHTCGACPYCTAGRENLCDAPGFTGYTRNGGFAEYCVADAHFVFPLPEDVDPVAQAPLLCAGLIGYRSFALASAGSGAAGTVPAGHELTRIGLFGFGAAAHILCQIAVWQEIEVYAVTRDGDRAAQDFARGLGAVWAGGASDPLPAALDAAIIFAPVGALVPVALRGVRKGGRVVCGGIHMSVIPGFPYADLWHERMILSVANLTRADGEAFFPLARAAGVRTRTTSYPLKRANAAIADLRAGRLQGAAVLVP